MKKLPSWGRRLDGALPLRTQEWLAAREAGAQRLVAPRTERAIAEEGPLGQPRLAALVTRRPRFGHETFLAQGGNGRAGAVSGGGVESSAGELRAAGFAPEAGFVVSLVQRRHDLAIRNRPLALGALRRELFREAIFAIQSVIILLLRQLVGRQMHGLPC